MVKLNDMTREEILEQIQNNNDEVGFKFQDAVEKQTEKYKLGVIHHEDYITQVELYCKQAREMLIKINWENESN